MTDYTKEEIQAILVQGPCEILFTKVNGEERQAVGTLHPDYLPQSQTEEGLSKRPTRAQSDMQVSYWDIGSDGWRSFRLDSLVHRPLYVGREDDDSWEHLEDDREYSSHED